MHILQNGEIISNMRQVRQINCRNIDYDNWEEFPADMPRDKSQTFEWIENTKNNQALYKCPDCGEITESEIVTE